MENVAAASRLAPIFSQVFDCSHVRSTLLAWLTSLIKLCKNQLNFAHISLIIFNITRPRVIFCWCSLNCTNMNEILLIVNLNSIYLVWYLFQNEACCSETNLLPFFDYWLATRTKISEGEINALFEVFKSYQSIWKFEIDAVFRFWESCLKMWNKPLFEILKK